VIQSRRGPRLAAKAFQRNRIVGRLFGQEFESDMTAELDVFGAVHNPHATAADLFQQTVVAND